ncbi:MAG TPA: haloacid dehalogenase-like hydrolase [Trebonia sp.]|nr:haloacid dehalogenase-like hydrolase [Trebonia sp.]
MLWNIDLTLVDVAKVIRPAYAEAFRKVTGRPLVQLPQMPGRSEPEIFFDALARNGISLQDGGEAERMVAPFAAELATAIAARRDLIAKEGYLLPGAAESLAALAKTDGIVQSLLTGSSRPNAAVKLRAFRLDRYVDFAIGGFGGSDPYPKAGLLEVARQRAEEKYRERFAGEATVYIADSPRDMEAATIAGTRSIGVASGRASTAELRASGADAVLPDLTDPAALLSLIETLINAVDLPQADNR